MFSIKATFWNNVMHWNAYVLMKIQFHGLNHPKDKIGLFVMNLSQLFQPNKRIEYWNRNQIKKSDPVFVWVFYPVDTNETIFIPHTHLHFHVFNPFAILNWIVCHEFALVLLLIYRFLTFEFIDNLSCQYTLLR